MTQRQISAIRRKDEIRLAGYRSIAAALRDRKPKPLSVGKESK